MGVGIEIKKILRDRNMTIKKLSEVSGISLNTLYSITKRDSTRVDGVVLQTIADSLGVPVFTLLGISPESMEQYSKKQKEHLDALGAKPSGEVSLGYLIRLARRNAGIDQETLAKNLDVHIQTIEEWESGVILPTQLGIERIVDSLRISVSELLYPSIDRMAVDEVIQIYLQNYEKYLLSLNGIGRERLANSTTELATDLVKISEYQPSPKASSVENE